MGRPFSNGHIFVLLQVLLPHSGRHSTHCIAPQQYRQGIFITSACLSIGTLQKDAWPIVIVQAAIGWRNGLIWVVCSHLSDQCTSPFLPPYRCTCNSGTASVGFHWSTCAPSSCPIDGAQYQRSAVESIGDRHSSHS